MSVMKLWFVALIGAAIGATALFLSSWAWLTREWWKP